MKYACNYAIVKFLPFVETGEFANIGVVLFCPEAKFFDFKLMHRGRKRTAFFDPLESKVFTNTKKDFQKTLNAFKELLIYEFSENLDQTRILFDELVRPREVLIRFDIPRTILTDNPIETLEQLYSFYVGRDFVTPTYAEKALERRLNLFLTETNLKEKYRVAHISGGAFKAKFPFAYKDQAGKVIKAIKPLHLGHHDPSQAYQHGWTWVGKLKQLDKHGVLPNEVLIAAERSDQDNNSTREVFQEIRQNFTDIGVKFVDAADTGIIRAFAAVN